MAGDAQPVGGARTGRPVTGYKPDRQGKPIKVIA